MNVDDVAVHNLTPPLVIAKTDAILTCPETLAQTYSEVFNLEVAELPLAVAPIDVKMVWHERNDVDPLHRWMRGEIEAAVRKTAGS